MDMRVDWDYVIPFGLMFIVITMAITGIIISTKRDNSEVKNHTVECKQIMKSTNSNSYQYDDYGNCYVSKTKIQHFPL